MATFTLTKENFTEFLNHVRNGHNPFKGDNDKSSAASLIGCTAPLLLSEMINKNEFAKKRLEEAIAYSKLPKIQLEDDWFLEDAVTVTVKEEEPVFSFTSYTEVN